MLNLKRINVFEAETVRYKKIQNLINLLQGTGNSVAIDSVLENGDVDTDLVDNETNELYILYKTNVCGTFVGEVRTEIFRAGI